MTHALILDDSMVVSRAIEDRLVSLRFDSFDLALTEARAIEAATARHPEIAVVGDSIACGSPIHAAQHIANQFGAPILLVAAGQCEVRRNLPRGVVLDGPFSLGDVCTAVALARAPHVLDSLDR